MDTVTDHRTRQVAAVMGLVASLFVASAIHLFGHVTGRSSIYRATDAGIAEAIIGVVLVWGAAVRTRTVELATIAVAIAGFLVGISITATSGHLPDIAYHAAVLPVLMAGAMVVFRVGK